MASLERVGDDVLRWTGRGPAARRGLVDHRRRPGILCKGSLRRIGGSKKHPYVSVMGRTLPVSFFESRPASYTAHRIDTAQPHESRPTKTETHCRPYRAVAIEPVSVNRLLQNGNFCGVGWRLLADSRLSCRFLDSWRPLRYAKIPANCRYFAQKLTTILGRVSAWLGREGSNLRMVESRSAAL